MAAWVIDKKAKTATVQAFGGVLALTLDERGKPLAKWTGHVPAESRGFRVQRAQAAVDAAVEGKAGDEVIEGLHAALARAMGLPDPVREEGEVSVTAFVHHHETVRAAMKAAPWIIAGSLGKTHPEFAATLADEEPPSGLPAGEPF